MTETLSAVSVSGLSYNYNKCKVLSDVSFQVDKGGFFIIAGPNGSGKTTLMRLMAGLIKPVSGDVFINGKAQCNYSRKRLSQITAFVPQMISIDFPVTVRDVIASGRAPYQRLLGFESSGDLKIIDDSMRITDTVHLKERKINELSGGECQRVFIASALCQEPEIMFLDEPTSALDLAHQIQIMDLMERLKNKTSMTVVMISHDINLAGMYADRLVLLKSGRVISEGHPTEILSSPVLESVFDCRIHINKNPFASTPLIFPVPEKYLSK